MNKLNREEEGRTSNKCLTPNHLCNLMGFKNKNVIFSHRLDFVSQE